MDAYYVLKVLSFNKENPTYTTVQQVGIDGFSDDTPAVSFNKSDNLPINEDTYLKYSLTTEKKVKQRGRANGFSDIFESFIAINNSDFYYCEHEKILILHCSKDAFKQFIKAFEGNNEYSFKKIDVDFESIIVNQHQIGVQGIWLGQLDDVNVKSLLLLGNNLESSTRYQDLKTEGAEISNLTIIYIFENIQRKIMISKDGGVIMYANEKESEALKLVKSIYKNLLS